MYLLLFVLLRVAQFFQSEPPIIISRETTYITEPLRPDGLPDYEKYVLELYRDGVTPDNNAAVLFWQAVWPDGLEPQDYEVMRAELGLEEIPSANAALQPVLGEANKKRVTAWQLKQHLSVEDSDCEDLIYSTVDRSWTSQQFPPLAEWVDANKKPLDLLGEASHRPRFYSPSPTLLYKKQRIALVAMLLPNTQAMRHAAQDLSVRAMWHVGEHRLNEAWTDLLAIHRLARLAAQGPTLVEQVVALSVGEIACRATIALLSSDRITIELAKQIHHDLAQLPDFSNVNACVDKIERLHALDTVIDLKLHGVGGFPDEPRSARLITNYMSIDWNVVLRRVNYRYDRLIAAMQRRTREARKKAFARLEADVTGGGQRFKQPIQLVSAFFSRQERSEMLGELIFGIFLPASESAVAFEERTKTNLQLTRIAAAIAAYRAEHQACPANLDELAPAFSKQVPCDIYHAKPFVYRRTDDGYLLYSCGDNGVDDGGSHEQWNILAGRSPEDFDESTSQKTQPQIPAGADDISVRVPCPVFKLAEPKNR